MSSLGKAFTVLNLALAGLFVGAAATLVGTSGEWRTRFEELQKADQAKFASLESTVSELRATTGQLEDEKTRNLNAIKDLEAQLKAAEADLTTERQKNADLRESLNGINAKLGDLEQTNRGYANRLDELARQADALRGERDRAQDERDAAVSQATAAREAARLADTTVSGLKAELARLQDQKETLETRLMVAARNYGFDPAELGTQPLDLEGLVVNASYDGNIPVVVLNIGRKDRVRPGYTFDVFSGSSYKGRVRVESVTEQASAAVIASPGAERIAPGDRVRTQL